MNQITEVGQGKYYLYRHKRADDDSIFYIGIGTKKWVKSETFKTEYARAHEKTGRNSHWHNVVNKYGYTVEIILESNTYSFIEQKEIEFIALYGRHDLHKGPLVNKSNGADYAPNNNKVVYQYSKDDTLIKKWDGCSIAGRELQIGNSGIAATATKNSKGERRTYKGFIWRYEDENNIVPLKPKIFPPRKNRKTGQLLESFPIYQYHPSGKFLKKWSGENEVLRELAIKSIRGKIVTEGRVHNGFKWLRNYHGETIPPFYCEMVDAWRPVIRLDYDTKEELEEYKTMNDAALKFTKGSLYSATSSLKAAIFGTRGSKSAWGYRWKFKE